MRKRRHREDFSEYVTYRNQFESLADQWKTYGFPNKVTFLKALITHAQARKNQEQPHVHDENCNHEEILDNLEKENEPVVE